MARYSRQGGSTERHCVNCKDIDRLGHHRSGAVSEDKRRFCKNKNNFFQEIFAQNSVGVFGNFKFTKIR
jgi:hypothetical protein